jgi:hypothetical protein
VRRLGEHTTGGVADWHPLLLERSSALQHERNRFLQPDQVAHDTDTLIA